MEIVEERIACSTLRERSIPCVQYVQSILRALLSIDAMMSARISALYEIAASAGARWQTVYNWPVAVDFGDPVAETQSARMGVAVFDASANGKIMVEGRETAAVLKAAWSAPELAVGAGVQVGADRWVYCLRPDLFFVHTPPGDEEDAASVLLECMAPGAGPITVTDMTDGLAELQIVGPAGRALLSRLCALDFRPAAFPDQTAKYSSLAKTRQLIIRRDLAGILGYSLIGARSLAAYLWETILHAGRDLGVRPVGVDAIAGIQAGPGGR